MAELIVVISIVGIIAAIAIPRFVARDTFDSRGFFDLAQETVRFAHKTSIAWRREVFVCVAANSVSAGTAAGCGVLLINPATGQPVIAAAPAGVTLAGAGFSFLSGGRPNPDQQITITINSTIPGDPPRRIVVERETGYIHN